MVKKNKKTKVIDFGQIEDTSATSQPLGESAAGEEDTAVSGADTTHAEITPVDPQQTSAEQAEEELSNASQATEEDESVDDLLDDVRRSLIEDESHTEEEKQSKWWNRLSKSGKGSKSSRKAKADKVAVVKDEPVDELVREVHAPVAATVEPVIGSQKTEPDPDPIDELIEILEHEPEHSVEKVKPAHVDKVEEVVPDPAPIVDVEELKKHAFSHREAEPVEDLSEVRAIALGGDEEVFVEVEATRQNPTEERLKAFENALKPYRTYINLVIAFLGVVMAVIASILLFNLYKSSLPAKPAEEISNLPYPTSVSLPGGWSFGLAKGSLVDGQWNPRGAEWLQGTEVCRWVALPWSRQLEAVVRTLNPKDPIELFMSNQDKLVYQVFSIHQMSPEEMQQLDSNSPCLLIVLAEPEAEKRWVLTAVP